MGGLDAQQAKQKRPSADVSTTSSAPGKQTLPQAVTHQTNRTAGGTYQPTFRAGAVPWGAKDKSAASRLDDEDVELRVIVAGFRAAQHALDSATDAQHAAVQCDVAVQHLTHVGHAVATFNGDRDGGAAIEAANSFGASLERAQRRAPDAVPINLRILNALIRRDLALDVSTAAVGPKIEHSSSKADITNAIVPALQLIAVRARDGLSLLQIEPPEAPNRDAKVAALSDELTASSRYASSLLGQLTFGERQHFVNDVEVAAAEMQKLVRWVRTRTPHAAMERSLNEAMRSFDAVSRSVGTAVIEQRDAATLSERSQHNAEVEEAKMNDAIEALTAAIDAVEKAQIDSVDGFEELARLDDVIQPELIETILKAVLAATMGYVTGELIKVLTTVSPMVAGVPAVAINDHLRMLVTVGMTTTNASIQGAWAEVTKDNSVGLARIVFVSRHAQ